MVPELQRHRLCTQGSGDTSQPAAAHCPHLPPLARTPRPWGIACQESVASRALRAKLCALPARQWPRAGRPSPSIFNPCAWPPRLVHRCHHAATARATRAVYVPRSSARWSADAWRSRGWGGVPIHDFGGRVACSAPRLTGCDSGGGSRCSCHTRATASPTNSSCRKHASGGTAVA